MKGITKTLFSVVSALTVLAVAAGCGSSSNGSQKSSGKATVTMWSDVSGDAKTAIDNEVSRYNKSQSNITIDSQYFESNAYKQKLQIVMGAKKGPDIFSNWGGGRLNDFIKANDVVDMTSYLKNSKTKYLPSIMKSVTFDGKIYGVPHGNIQQVNFFYNKSLFKKYGLTPPKTWDELLSDVKVLKSKGIAPIALGGGDKWPDLMYFEYLVDRIGGPTVFQNIQEGKPNAWSQPEVIQALKMMQQLANAGGFESGFSSVGSGNGEDAALVYTNKAAMWLMGSWGYTSILSDDKSFIDDGNLGWFSFPAVTGGKGDPADVAGNPSEFYSISSNSKNKDAAAKFLVNGNLDKQNVKDLINIGNVPPVQGIESQLKQAKGGDYMTFSYDLIKNAPYFQQSWDTALSTKTGNELDDDLSKLLINQMTPQQVAADMQKFKN
ncbi:extracellular solute-binding protein [Pullulanibacillus sp. KACC 23026]|uniref:extracellular solute-binding protein n=1 Tax=Pullulanibacillus sp. KACC 23026 TaxID=3028315 RepID=UPI0023B11794|nr:extracellular solute-binding protein [Pullulanibacillus sp. KACC 23026]WEG12865.1 extracellular solute-binding protein [Pullulanibacillus sp. KACC 23026]